MYLAPSKAHIEWPDIFGVEELMSITTYSKASIYRMVKDDEIPAHQPKKRGKIFFLKEKIIP